MASIVRTVDLSIGGMTCVNCQHKIENMLRDMPGVLEAQMSYRKGIGTISYDTQKLSLEKIV